MSFEEAEKLIQEVIEIGDEGAETSLDISDANLSQLPENLRELTELECLTLSRNELTTLPDWIGDFSKLTLLDLDDNKLTALPESLSGLTSLTCLSVSENVLATLPKCLAEMPTLEQLYLDANQLKDSETLAYLGEATNVVSLLLKDNGITKFPEALLNLTRLETLDFADNVIGELPADIGKMVGLVDLDLDSTGVQTLPESFSNLQALEILSMADNEIPEVPAALRSLGSLHTLSLQLNDLTDLPVWIGELSLKSIDLIDNAKIVEFPMSLLGLAPQLETLWISDCGITELPDAFGDFQSLEDLFLCGNPLRGFPQCICKLESLMKLDLEGCGLSDLPDALGDLTGLFQLDIGNNGLTELPEWIGKLHLLETFKANKNALSTLPDCLMELSDLHEPDFRDNQIASLSPEMNEFLTECQAKLDRNPITSKEEATSETASPPATDKAREMNLLPGEREFLQQVVANPLDLDSKRIYADWLEERGDSRGTLLRQVASVLEASEELPAIELPPEGEVPYEWLELIGYRLVSHLQNVEKKIANTILSVARPSLRIITSEANELPVGSSKMGGLPDLPADFNWPVGDDCKAIYNDDTAGEKRLAGFLAQINLEEVGNTFAGEPFFAKGLLSFFGFQDWENDNPDLIGAMAVYFPNVAELSPTAPPAEQTDGNETITQERIRFKESLDLPEIYGGPWSDELKDASEKCPELFDVMFEANSNNLLGYARATSGDDPTPNKETRHLLTLSNEYECRLHLQISTEDLKAMRFERLQLAWVDFD